MITLCFLECTHISDTFCRNVPKVAKTNIEIWLKVGNKYSFNKSKTLISLSQFYLCTKFQRELLNHFFVWFWKKIAITNSYFIFLLIFICQNVGNLKGFLLVC